MENYEHYITKNIRELYQTKMVSPILYLILLVFLWIFSPISEMVFPEKITEKDDLESVYAKDVSFIQTDFSTLYFSGYTKTRFGITTGYYYYTTRNDECIVVLLSPSTSQEGLPEISSLTVQGRLVKGDKAYRELLVNLADTLDWTETGITSKVSPFYLSEPDCHNFGSYLLLFLYFASFLYATVHLILSIVYYRFPQIGRASCRERV